MVENRPYVPSLMVDLNDQTTVVNAVKVILSCIGEIKADTEKTVKVSIMSGGLTNALFRVDIDNEQQSPSIISSVLVRIFDRDKETATFARLCNSKGSVVHPKLDYLGRFGPCNS